jgi:hypothetical protein
VKTDFVEL